MPVIDQVFPEALVPAISSDLVAGVVPSSPQEIIRSISVKVVKRKKAIVDLFFQLWQAFTLRPLRWKSFQF